MNNEDIKTPRRSYINFVENITKNNYDGKIVINSISKQREEIRVTLSVTLSSLGDAVWYGTGHMWTYEYSIKENEIKLLSGKCTGGAVYSHPDRYIDILYEGENLLSELLKGAVSSILIQVKSSNITCTNIFNKIWCFDGDSCKFQIENLSNTSTHSEQD